MLILTLSLLSLSNTILQCLCAPQVIQATPDLQPVITENFPDPAIIKVNNIFYAFSTQSGGAHVPTASSPDIGTLTPLKDPQGNPQDAMPTLPSWTPPDYPSIWAPDVIQLKPNLFLLYFSANTSSNHHCIGAATSNSVTGPYIPTANPLACPLSQGGAIDPAGFIDTDGKTYVVYKIDGNSLGGGGPCGNANGQFATPLMLQEVSSDDGYTLIGDPVELLNRDDNDGPLIEAPSLVRTANGAYVLFFSSNCYNTAFYDSSYATSDSLKGPYTKASRPLLTTGEDGLLSPGGTDVLADGSSIVFHADKNPGDPAVRQMYAVEINL